MARLFWPGGDPLGDHLVIGRGVRPEYQKDPARQIIGIVGDVRDSALNRVPRPAMYVPIAQLPDDLNLINLRLLPIAWFVRASGASHSAIQNELQQVSGGLPVSPIRSMDEVATQSTARTRFEMLLMTIFGGAALLLAAVGVYGLIAYSVEQRTQELGIRLALGARSGKLRNMIVFQGMRLALVGVGAGLAGAFGLTRLIAGFLFGVRPWDPAVFATVAIVLAAVALFATWLPARRAMRIDPVAALRWE